MSPFPTNSTSSLLAIGGLNLDTESGTNSVWSLKRSGWQNLNASSPHIIWGHCMLISDSNTVWVIGGCSSACVNTNRVVYLNPATLQWGTGPNIITGRHHHTCSMIWKNYKSLEQTKIVVGGTNNNGVILYTVEIFDDQSNSWIMGPQLPIPISHAAMINDDKYGIILIGGYSGQAILNTFYYLQTTASQWSMMSMTLKTPRLAPIAFPIPHNITNCV